VVEESGLDFRTITLWNSVLLFAMTILLLVLFLSFRPRQNAIAVWALAYATLMVGSIAFSLRGIIPDFISIVAANVGILLFFPIVAQGIRILWGERPRWHLLAYFSVPIIAWEIAFGLVRDVPNARTVFYTAVLALAGLGVGFGLLFRKRAADAESPVLVAVFAIAVGLLQVLRLVFIIVYGYPSDVLKGAPWDAVIQALSAMLGSMMAVPLVFLITNRLHAEVARAAKERELLLREMTHRIKNDLTLVDSLISLKESSLADERLREDLSNLRERIRCIAMAHDQFSKYRGEVGPVRLGEYLEVILSGLPVPGTVAIRRELENTPVPFSLAVSLGLAVNELVTNSLKYAFPAGRRGTIELAFGTREGRGTLVVRDDGIGVSWPPREPGLGALILESMVQAVGGRLEHSDAGGSRFTLEFPLGPSPSPGGS
jgi:two-component sensor histidine kinase